MREGSPKKFYHGPTGGGFRPEAKSLFGKILDLSPCDSIFCPIPGTPSRAKFMETKILADGYQKKRIQILARLYETFRPPSETYSQSETLPAGSACLFSSAPYGAC